MTTRTINLSQKALRSVMDYIENQQKLDNEYAAKLGIWAGQRQWWPMLPGTIKEVRAALR